MEKETAGTAFFKYGNVFKGFCDDRDIPPVCRTERIVAQNSHSRFVSYSCDVCIELQSGLGILLVSTDPEKDPIEEFPLDRHIRIKARVYFCFVATTPELEVRIYSENSCHSDTVTISNPYVCHPVLPQIRLQKMLGYYYRVRSPGYQFSGEQHAFFELTYVDTGVLYTRVDGVDYKLGEKELMIYGPGQFHTQHTDDQSASYITIIFNMENLTPGMPEDWYAILTDRVFPYNKHVYTPIKNLVQESASAAPYTESLLHCLLTEVILRLLQGIYTAPVSQPSGMVRKNYQMELFDRVLTYVESKLYEPLSVADICQQFSLSRSTLQLLFKNNVNKSPKKYISDMKLEKSCQMLRENKYTISEISLKLGYSSIHYFSNAFNQKYHIPPSEYARRSY